MNEVETIMEITRTRNGGYTKFEQRYPNPHKIGLKGKVVSLDVRRVTGHVYRGEEVQIEISIVEIKGDQERHYQTCASLHFTPKQAKKLVDAITTPRE